MVLTEEEYNALVDKVKKLAIAGIMRESQQIIDTSGAIFRMLAAGVDWVSVFTKTEGKENGKTDKTNS